MLEPRRQWAVCGAMGLTGDAEGPPLAPPTRAAVVADRAARRFGLDAAVLAERAALAGLRRRGQISCGGFTRLLRAADGWLALALPRADDLTALPALLGVEADSAAQAWPPVAAAVARRATNDVVETAALLGMACAKVGESAACFTSRGTPRPGAARPHAQMLVVELAALWAGPLCADLLRRLGARVVKVEDRRRPDTGRWGAPAFFDLLNAGKESVVLDFGSTDGRAALRNLVEAADVVVTSARARAVHQLGLEPDEVLTSRADKVWVAVTGHGWCHNRIGFGDDAAVAAGLVAWHPLDGQPRFAGDAVADPLCGLLAAEAAVDAIDAGGRWFIDASLTGAAAGLTREGPALAADMSATGEWRFRGVRVERALVRAAGRARPLGSDTDAVLAELAV